MNERLWRVGWKPIDKATATPEWSDVIFDSFMDASHVAASLNKADPENHYFPDLMPEQKPKAYADPRKTKKGLR